MLFELFVGLVGVVWAASREMELRRNMTPDELTILETNTSSTYRFVYIFAAIMLLIFIYYYGFPQIHLTHLGLVLALTLLSFVHELLLYSNLSQSNFPSFYLNALMFNNTLKILSLALVLWAIPLRDFFGIPIK